MASLMLALQDEHSAAFSPHLDRLLARTEAWAAEPGARTVPRRSIATTSGGP